MEQSETSNEKNPEEIIDDQRIPDNIVMPVFFEPDSAEAKRAPQEMLRMLLDGPALLWSSTIQNMYCQTFAITGFELTLATLQPTLAASA